MAVLYGLDLGSSSIKLIGVEGKKVKFGTVVPNPLGKVGAMNESEATKMGEVIKKVVTDNKLELKKVHVVLPESLVFSRVIQMPVLSDAELASAIRYEAEQYVPVPLDEVELSYEVLYRPSIRQTVEKMEVMLAASPRKDLESIVDMFAQLEIEPESMEPELVAAARSVMLGHNYTEPALFCSLGAAAAGMGVFKGEQLAFVYRFGSGGTAMTRSIAVGLSMSVQQAEEFKRAYGVRTDMLEGKLVGAMAAVTDGLMNEIKKAQSFYSTIAGGGRLGRVILAGGVAMTPGLIELMSRKLGVEVVLGDPLLGMSASPEINKLAMQYAPAIGAAIR